MICYKDRTFCVSENCTCDRKLTREIIEDAIKWWGNKDAPIAIGFFCGGQSNYNTEESKRAYERIKKD